MFYLNYLKARILKKIEFSLQIKKSVLPLQRQHNTNRTTKKQKVKSKTNNKNKQTNLIINFF